MPNGNNDDAILLEGMSGLRRGGPIIGAGVYRGELGSLESPDFVAPEPGEEAEEFDVAESIQKFEATYSKAADPVSAMDQAALTRELEEAIDQQLRATRPGHDDDWYQTRIDERIRQHDFYPRNYAPAPPTPPSVDFLREVYQKYPDELRATYRPDSSIGRVIASLASDKPDDEIQELVDNTSVGEWPSEFTWGTGFLNAMQRGLSRRVIEVEAGADMPGREQRWEHRRQVARELQQVMDEESWGAGVGRMWKNGPSMDENDAYRAGLFLDEDEATARELTVTTSLGAAAGSAVRSNLGHLLPRGAVWGRRLGGLRSAAAGGRVGAPAGPWGILIGGVIGGFIGYGAGKIWGKVDTKEFLRPVPAFGSTTGDDSYYFALPQGLVNISSRLMVLTGLADVAHVPYLASNDEDADRMRDIIAMSRPSESWGSLVSEYRNARNSGKTSKELREELRPMMGGMVRNVAWADLPESARHTDKLDLAEAIDYAHSNRDMGDAGAPDFTFEYLVALINEGKTEKVRLQRVLDSLPIGQILNHVPYIIVGDEHQTGSIPSMDTFIDGVLVAAGDTEEAYSLTGVDTTRDLATGFAELMLERREVDGQVRYVENTPGKVFRVLSAIPELYFETRLPYDIPLTPASRDFRYGLGIRDPDVGYWARVLSNIETGEIGLTRHVTDEMLSRGVDRQSGLYRGFATGAVMGDWLVYWERPFIAGIGGPTRAGLRGYGAWKQFKDNPLRLQATVAGISPRLYAFRNKVDIQNTQAWANITRFLGDSGNTVEGLTALKGGKAADGADVVLGVREAGLVDRMIEAMEQGKNFDDAADSLPSAKDHDWYTVQSHLLSEGVKSGVIKGDDVWAVVPKPMRSQVIQVMAAAGVEPTSAIRALNQYILKARKINLHAMEKLLTEGTPEMIAFRSSDQYGNLRKLLLDSVSESGGAVDHVNISMPKLELQAWIAALDPQKPHIKSMEDYFDALRVVIEEGGGPPPPKPKRPKPPGDEPIEVGPIDKEPDEVGPTDYPRDPAPAPRSFDDQWEWIEVIESAHGGYWKRKGEGRTVTSPIMTSDRYGADPDQAISVYRHSPVFGETPSAGGEWRGGKIIPTGVYGKQWNPIMHATRGADKPAMTLYGYIEGSTYHFTAAITQTESAARVTDVREMYRSLVKESLAEFKQHLDSDPEAFYQFTLQKSKMKAHYDPEGGKLTPDGDKSKSFRFYKADHKKLGLESRVFDRMDILELPDLTLKKWRKAARKAASDPDVTPPSGMVDPPKSWSKEKIGYMNDWKKWAEDSGMDPLISKVSESFMTILPNEAFRFHRLEFNPYHPRLFGSASIARGSNWSVKNAVRLYMVGKGIKYDPDTSPLAKMTDEDLAADARKALDSVVLRRKKEHDPEWSSDEMWLHLETDPYFRAQRNQFIEALGPHIAEMVRREPNSYRFERTRAQRLRDELFASPRVEDADPGWQQEVFRHHVYAALVEAETAVRQHERFKFNAAHTFVHEMTHVLHYSVLSEKELKALRRAYNRERRNKFPNWRRSESFKGKWNTESSFAEWLADTVSDYWISGNASRHGLFTQEEVSLLQTFIRRVAYHFKALFAWNKTSLQKAGFPKEIIDLLERLTKQALDETTGQVGIRPISKLMEWPDTKKLGPTASVPAKPVTHRRIPSQEWRDNWHDKPAKESAKWLRDQVDNDLQKAVLDKVIESLDETGTSFWSTSVKTYLSDLPGRNGEYHPDRGWVVLDLARSSWNAGGSQATAIHELVHATTVGKIHLHPDSIQVKRLDLLFDEAKSKTSNPGLYGFKDRLEFIAEAFSNPKFQDELRSITISDELAAKLGIADPNLWEGFVAIIRQLLGISDGDQSALSGVLKITEDITVKLSAQRKPVDWAMAEPVASVLNRISDEKMVSASASAKAPHWVQSISDMPEEAATAAAHQIARNYASVGSRAYDDIVSYILTNGREGKLNSKILDDFKPSSPSTVPSTGPAKLWRIFYDSKFVDKEGVSKLISSQEVWNSLDASLLYQMMKSGDINMLFNNGGQLLRRFLGPRDYRHLIRELETKGRREHLTPDGEVAAQKAFKSYIETGKASGPLLPLFEQLYLNLQSYWLRFSKDRDLVASPEIRAWFDKWLAPDLNLRPLAAEITERVLSRFKQVRIAEPEELLKRLEEGMVGLMGRKEEFWRVPLDTPTVRNALGITEYTREMDVVDVFSRAVGYVAGEHARIMSGPENIFPLTARSHIPQSRVKRVQEATHRRLYQLFNGRLDAPVPGTGAMAGGLVHELSPAQAAAFRVFLRSLSAEPLANILPIRLLDEATDLSQIPTKEFDIILEALMDIEAGVASSRTHYSERISPTLAVAMWNGLKQMSVNSEKYSEVMKKVSGGIRTRFSEVSDLSDLGPFQRQVVEMTTRELGGVPNEMLRWLLEYKKGNKDATLHEMYLSMKNQLEPPVRPELVELIMGRPATPTDKGAKGWVIELERFHGRLEADPEGAALPAQRRREALLGKADDEVRYEDPTGGDIAGSFLDHILDNLPNLQRMMEQEKSSHPIYGRLTEHDHHSLHILQTYKDSLAKYRRQSELGAPPKQLDEMLSDQDFYNVEEALYYVLDRIRRQKERITQRAMKIGRGLAGDTDFADAGFMASTDVQGMYYRMFYGGKWVELFEDFGTRTGMATGLEKTTGKAPEIDPGTALVYMIATLRADEVLEGLAGTLAKYGIAKDVRELTANYASSRVAEGQYSGINRDLFHGRIQFYIERILSFQMSTKKYRYTPSYTAKAGDTLESIAMAHGVRVDQLRAWNILDEGAVLSPGQVIKTADAKMLLEHPRAPFTEKLAPVLPAKETGRAKARGAPEDFYGNVHDLEAYTVAVNIIHQWGFRTAKEGFDLRVLPDGSRVFAPKAVWKHLDDAMDRATGAGTARGVVAHRVDPTPLGLTDYKWSSEAERKMAVGRAVDAIGNMFPSTIARIKMGVTTGIILPNPAYFTGVFLGAGFQAMQGIGPVGFFKMMRNPRQTGAVVARLWKEGSFAPDAPPIVAKNGKTYTVEMLTELAEAHGLKSSFIHAETMKAIASDIREFHPGFWNKMRVGRWAKNWQKTLIESATALDNYWRVSVFIHEIRMGKDPSAAAAKARLVGYDYAALTKFEKKYARNTIMFYSYMRKNMDLFWDTLLTHPERLIGQMRLLRGIHTAWLEDDPQIVLKDYLHGRLPTYFRNTSINTHKYSQWMFISPPLPMMDALNIYIDLYDLVAFKDEEALRGLATRAAPWVQAPFVLATGKDIFWDKELNEYNKIPPWLMEMDLALTGGALVHGVFGAQLRPHNDLSKADISGEPEHGWYHARNGRAWWIWRSLLQTPGAGRSMDTISYMDRANLGPIEGLIRSARWARRTGAESGWWSGVPEMREGDTMGPRTGLTEREEFAGLLGFKPIHVPQRSHQTAVDSIIMNRQMRQILARERLSEED